MTPTQAQIDAALKAYSEAGAGHRGGMVAALTAAAQYVPKNDPRLDEVVGGPKKKRIGFAGAIDEAIAKEVAATIERCAQVADGWAYSGYDEGYTIAKAIAAAIRALATEERQPS